ncbi:MAG: glycerol-3-phosphate 1-O-acyltransferase PlsY [Peptococcaceae bacterium]|nr:glycerol-3-phosphate 1-O-acyltransferase PlsY [Peptococcaceae bacterium]
MLILAIISSYLIGSIPFGFILGKLKGVDVRVQGSGNIGATNVWRTIGPQYGALVLVLDALKGVAGVYLGRSTGIEGLELVTGISAILGHAFPIFLNFRGGKVIATGLGVITALSLKVSLVAVAVFSVVFLLFGYVSLGSIAAAAAVPLAMLFFNYDRQYFVFALILSFIAIYRHIPNIKRLIRGTENRVIGFKAKK